MSILWCCYFVTICGRGLSTRLMRELMLNFFWPSERDFSLRVSLNICLCMTKNTNIDKDKDNQERSPWTSYDLSPTASSLFKTKFPSSSRRLSSDAGISLPFVAGVSVQDWCHNLFWCFSLPSKKGTIFRRSLPLSDKNTLAKIIKGEVFAHPMFKRIGKIQAWDEFIIIMTGVVMDFKNPYYFSMLTHL